MCHVRGRVSTFVVAGILVTLMLALPAGAQGEQRRSETEASFDAALKLYREGEYDKAADALDKVIEMSPTSEEALILREKAGMGMLVKMLMDPRLGQAAREILHKAAKEAERVQRDPATLKELISKLGSEDVAVRWGAIRHLTAAGPFAVPYLLDHALGDELPSGVSRKVAAWIALRKMKSSGIPALVVALRNADTDAAMPIVRMLAENPDARAVPVLAEIAQDEAHPGFLREAAAKALESMLGVPADPAVAKGKKRDSKNRLAVPAMPQAADAALALALRYYYADPTLIEITPPHERVLWRWNGEGETYEQRLTFDEVPAFAHARMMAEDTLLAGMAPGHTNPGLLELYICNSYVQLEDAIAAESERAEALAAVPAINESLGAKYLYPALGRALRDGNTLLARRCIEALRNVGDPRVPEGENTALTALAYPDKFVRVAAAETLISLSPTGDLGGGEDVVHVLAAGLGVSSREIIVLLTADDDLASSVAEDVTSWNMVPRIHADSAAVLGRIKDGLPPVNLFIVDTRIDGIAVPVIVQSVRKDARSAGLPIILLALQPAVERLRTSYGERVVAVLPVAYAPDALKTATEAALASAQADAASDVRENAELLRRVLRSAASLPPGTKYPAGMLAGAAAELLREYPDDIRILALGVIANLPDPRLQYTIYEIFADAEQPLEVRQHAGAALLRLLAVNGALESAQRDQLRAMTSDPDGILRSQAVHALAIASVPQAEREKRLLTIGANVPAGE